MIDTAQREVRVLTDAGPVTVRPCGDREDAAAVAAFIYQHVVTELTLPQLLALPSSDRLALVGAILSEGDR